MGMGWGGCWRRNGGSDGASDVVHIWLQLYLVCAGLRVLVSPVFAAFVVAELQAFRLR